MLSARWQPFCSGLNVFKHKQVILSREFLLLTCVSSRYSVCSSDIMWCSLEITWESDDMNSEDVVTSVVDVVCISERSSWTTSPLAMCPFICVSTVVSMVGPPRKSAKSWCKEAGSASFAGSLPSKSWLELLGLSSTVPKKSRPDWFCSTSWSVEGSSREFPWENWLPKKSWSGEVGSEVIVANGSNGSDDGSPLLGWNEKKGRCYCQMIVDEDTCYMWLVLWP